MKSFITLLAVALAINASAQTATPQTSWGNYQHKSAGDKANSDAEFSALAYMRTVVAAAKIYHRKHNAYPASLAALVGSGSFTRRMAKTDRGDYTVLYKARPQGYSLALTPRHFDPAHRSFYVDESGQFRAQEGTLATTSSPSLN